MHRPVTATWVHGKRMQLQDLLRVWARAKQSPLKTATLLLCTALLAGAASWWAGVGTELGRQTASWLAGRTSGTTHVAPSSTPDVRTPSETPRPTPARSVVPSADDATRRQICNAESYLAAGSIEDREKALQIFRSVAHALLKSGASSKGGLLQNADVAYRDHHNAEALRLYRTLVIDLASACRE